VKVHFAWSARSIAARREPGIIEQQIQSGIVFGLTAALKGGITIEKGRCSRATLTTTDVLRIDENAARGSAYRRQHRASRSIGEARHPGIAPACN